MTEETSSSLFATSSPIDMEVHIAQRQKRHVLDELYLTEKGGAKAPGYNDATR